MHPNIIDRYYKEECFVRGRASLVFHYRYLKKLIHTVIISLPNQVFYNYQTTYPNTSGQQDSEKERVNIIKFCLLSIEKEGSWDMQSEIRIITFIVFLLLGESMIRVTERGLITYVYSRQEKKIRNKQRSDR